MSDKKQTKNKKKSSKQQKKAYLRCGRVSFVKEPANEQQRKIAMVLFNFESANGEFKTKKQFDDVWKFIDTIAKSGSGRKDISLQKSFAKVKRHRDEYTKNGKIDKILTSVNDFISQIGRNKKLVQQSNVASFCGAKKGHAKAMSAAKAITWSAKKMSKTNNHKTITTTPGPVKRLTIGQSEISNSNSNSNNKPHLQQANTNTNTIEISKLKEKLQRTERKYMAQVHELKQNVTDLQQQNSSLNDTLSVQTSTNKELLDKVESLERELGKDTVTPSLEKFFPDIAADSQDEDDPAEKYFQKSKELRKRVVELETQLKELVDENGEMKIKEKRLKYIVDELTNNIANRTDTGYEQLESDYKEVEAECDELNDQLALYKDQLKQSMLRIDEMEKLMASNKSKVDEYPQLQDQLEKNRSEIEAFRLRLSKISDERDRFEDLYIFLQKKQPSLMPIENHKNIVKQMKSDMQTLIQDKNKIEAEKVEAMKDLAQKNNEMANIKIANGRLASQNEKLIAGGGQNVNLGIDLNLEFEFSLFNQTEFNFPANVSRAQLHAWAEHVQILTSEIQQQLCLEVDSLHNQRELLENYIHSKGLPSPEETISCGEANATSNDISSLPHPLPSMTFEDLQLHNPTKTQLIEYINLMFKDWHNDEIEHQTMLKNSSDNAQLMHLLDVADSINETTTTTTTTTGDETGISNKPPTSEYKQQLQPQQQQQDDTRNQRQKIDELYLRIEEMEEEHKRTTNQKESEILQLQLRIRELNKERKKNISIDDNSGQIVRLSSSNGVTVGAASVAVLEKPEDDTEGVVDVDVDAVDENANENENENESIMSGGSLLSGGEETITLRNQLSDLEQYTKTLVDDMRQLTFECEQQKNIIQREHQHELDILRIDLENAIAEVDDLTSELKSEHLESAANEFRIDLKEERSDKALMKKAHIEHIQQYERQCDELLREINLLRIKTDRMDMDTDEIIKQKDDEIEKIRKELEHFVTIAGNVEQMREMLNREKAATEAANESYENLKHQRTLDLNRFEAALNSKQKQILKLEKDLNQAEEDYKFFKTTGETILSRREVEEMLEMIQKQKNKLCEAVNSKFSLLKSSSMEINRLRDEIRLLCGDRKLSKRDFKPNRYHGATAFSRYHVYYDQEQEQEQDHQEQDHQEQDENRNRNRNRNQDDHVDIADPRFMHVRMLTSSSIGSNIPLALTRTQSDKLRSVTDRGYAGKVWSYTLGMVSQMGSSIYGVIDHTINSGGTTQNCDTESDCAFTNTHTHTHTHTITNSVDNAAITCENDDGDDDAFNNDQINIGSNTRMHRKISSKYGPQPIQQVDHMDYFQKSRNDSRARVVRSSRGRGRGRARHSHVDRSMDRSMRDGDRLSKMSFAGVSVSEEFDIAYRDEINQGIDDASLIGAVTHKPRQLSSKDLLIDGTKGVMHDTMSGLIDMWANTDFRDSQDLDRRGPSTTKDLTRVSRNQLLKGSQEHDISQYDRGEMLRNPRHRLDNRHYGTVKPKKKSHISLELKSNHGHESEFDSFGVHEIVNVQDDRINSGLSGDFWNSNIEIDNSNIGMSGNIGLSSMGMGIGVIDVDNDNDDEDDIDDDIDYPGFML